MHFMRIGAYNMKLRQKCFSFLSAVLVAAAAIPVHAGAAIAVPPGAIGSVTVNSATTFYYDTPVSGGTAAMWEEAAKADSAIVKLYADWSAKDGSQLAAEGKGGAFAGALCIPAGSEITIDLNGFSIDRTLSVAMEHGEVIYVESGATLNLTDTSGTHDGRITGGNSTDSAGGIHVENGGKINLWGGTISGNRTDASGGGIFLAGADSSLYMTGGIVTENEAAVSGGGIAVVDGSMRVISGSFTNNSTGATGGGIYIQGGTADLSGCKITGNKAIAGGGICTNADAVLMLKDDTAVQKNTLTPLETAEGEEVSAEKPSCIGGGIFAMSARPIKLSGTPSVTMNTNELGRQSNLVFYAEEGRVYAEGRLADEGVSAGAKLGLSFTGGTERDHFLAAGWTEQGIFSMDTPEFSLYEEEGNLYLRRPASLPGTWFFVAVGCGTALVLSIIAFFVLRAVYKKRNQKKHRKKKKKPVQAE